MLVVIHIEIGAINKLSYTKEILSWLRDLYPQLVTYDFDNHSDAAIINYGMDLLKQGKRILVMINQISDENTRPLLKFTDCLIRNRAKSLLVIYNGTDPYLKQMLETLPKEKLIGNMDDAGQKAIIENFFSIK